MADHPLFFFFYRVTSPWNDRQSIARGMRVDPGPGEAYGRNFLSLWYEIPNRSRCQSVLVQLGALERGLMPHLNYCSKLWEIHVTTTEARFVSHQFPEWNTGSSNIIPYAEFKYAVLAWEKFLNLPEEPEGAFYHFSMPATARPGDPFPVPTLRRQAA